MATPDKTQLLNRARSIEGHMGAIVRMLEQDTYCVDIIKQTQAIQKAIDKLNALLLKKHMNECVTTAIRSDKPQERERVVNELLEVFQTANKL
ncbi:MAG: metal-sensitive transcriptional regulator [Anaerolineae bacterium]|nr:metal-sensitive transcriptional regulator [Anaerolineae bacterium]